MSNLQPAKTVAPHPAQAPKAAQAPKPAQPASPLQALQNLMTQGDAPKIDKAHFEEWKGHALQDQKLDRDEAKFLMDQMGAGRFESDVVPAVTELLSKGFNALTPNPIAFIGGNRISHIHRVDSSFKLEDAKQITDGNGIDEIYFRKVNDKGELEGDLFVAYGAPEEGGSLNLDHIKPGYVGRMDNQKIKVVHINNETNTYLEGAKSPWVSTWHTLKDAGQSGIAKGIGEVATTVTALFIGKTVVENGVKSVTTGLGNAAPAAVAAPAAAAGTAASTVVQAGAAAAENLVPAAAAVAETAAPAVATKALPAVVQEAKTLGSTIGSSVKSSLRSVVVGAAVAGAVIGTVVTIGSGIGMAKSRFNHRDYTTLDMVTGNY